MADKVDNRQNEYNRHRINRSVTTQSARLQTPKGVEKAPFEKVLEESQQDLNWPQPNASNTTQTQEAVQSLIGQQERESQQKDDSNKRFRKKDPEAEDRSGKSESSSTVHAKEADRRVVGRNNLSERHQGQGGKHSSPGDQNQQNRGQDRGLPVGADSNASKSQVSAQTAKSKFEAELQIAQSMTPATLGQATTITASQTPQQLPKAVLDQIVRYFRVVTKTDGDKEVDMQLHEEIFKGLKLKVSVSGGRVSATLTASTPDVARLFLSHKSDLRKTLEEKGIDVASLDVLVG